MAKLVDALVSGASAARHGGSSPFPGTNGEFFIFDEEFPVLFFLKANKLRFSAVSPY